MDFAQLLQDFQETLGLSKTPCLSKKERQTLYCTAYGMYESGEYESGTHCFTTLILHDPYNRHYWKGLASCHQMQKDYKAALHAWAVLSLLTNHSPDAHFHAAECYLSLGKIEEAKKALSCAQLHLKEGDPLQKKIHYLQAEYV